MSQQINLINPSLIKQKDFLNSNNIAITLGLLSVLMLGYYSYAQKQLSLLTTQRSQIAEELTATQATLQQTVLLHTPHDMNKALLDQITQLEHKEAMQQQILQTVKQSSATPEKGYAALMRAFAKQSVDGLWLTSFSVDSRSEQLNINGRTLQGDLVPEYISRLGNEPALKGKLFAALNMSLPKTESSATSAAPVPIAPIATASIIKNGVSAMPVTTSTPVAVIQNNEPKYIEFSLHSTNEKSATRTITSEAGGKL
ncbi:MAG: PilN domain-containing protein [Methylotenera sp.]|uniref:PilN domain-containing protein n=1 Tax=Methylotenera sp. TaxID=2051956 RepID=UPI00271955E8|nr:PilN domain-containing protein [Methylotenera sp.]MDO9392389.1 PilN domain-containing protein [Methylotenera sp.]MDP2231554.1 PilN domain-containing protein [Methylotenera sp.]MDP3141757.1 PilN domain-containing protein [Methylotenera sp.]MDP3309221.1 PilN domain-containing protein [Methylotenera sp.]